MLFCFPYPHGKGETAGLLLGAGVGYIGFPRPLAAVLSIEFPWNRAQKKSDPNAETNGFATFAKLKHVDFDSVAETFRDGSDGYSGHLITCA